MSPKGQIIVVENEDKPGVIGNIGLTLADDKVNIESFIFIKGKRRWLSTSPC